MVKKIKETNFDINGFELCILEKGNKLRRFEGKEIEGI